MPRDDWMMATINSPRANLILGVCMTVMIFYLGGHPSTAGVMPDHGYSFAHFASFGALAFCYGRGLPRVPLLFVAILVTTIGGLLELYQSITPSHHADLDDLLIDAAGALCGTLISRVSGYRIQSSTVGK